MRPRLVFVVFAGLAVGILLRAEPASTTAAPALAPGKPPPGYVLAWADEFDGDHLDLARWIHRTGARHWSTQRPENVAVHDGCLWLAGKKESGGGLDYTAGGVISRRAFRYGYYEARFKVPPTAGWHTSFWMMHHLPANAKAREGSRLEVDVCENDSIHPTRYAVNLHQWLPAHRVIGQKSIATPDLSASFHVWACEFTPERIIYYFDGAVVQTTATAAIPEQGDMSVWLTTVASHLGRTPAVDESRLPVYAVFDYVRVYERQ